MTDLRTAAQQALEYMDAPSSKLWPAGTQHQIITALKAALAEPVQRGCDHCNQPLYAAIKCRVCGRETKPERNFCPRCGKRTRDIHTCTPPGDCDVHG